MKYSELYFHDLRTVKRRNVRILSHSHKILRKFNRKVLTSSKKSIRGNMAPSDHTMNVWPLLIHIIPLSPFNPVHYKTSSFVSSKWKCLWTICYEWLLDLVHSFLLFRVSTYRLNKGFIEFISFHEMISCQKKENKI